MYEVLLRKVSMAAIFLMLPICLAAQNMTITAAVLLPDGSAAEAASVRIKGAATGTTTNGQGIFTIRANPSVKDSTLRLLTAEKAKIAAMQRYGVLEGFCHDQLLKAFEQENARRKEMVDKGQVIYGLQYFDELNFYTYILSNALLETERKINREYPPSERELQELYDKIKQEEFRIPPTFYVTYVVIHPLRPTSFLYRDLLQQVASGNYERVSDTISSKVYTGLINQMDIELSPATRRTDELKWGKLVDYAMAFKKNKSVSPVFSDEDGNACFLLCREIHDNGYYTLKDVAENVKKYLAVKKFENEFARALGSLRVKRCEDTWDRLVIE